jgi:HK97 family phage major capsid protein
MPNAVLESLRAQRAEQIGTMDAILGQIEGRDMVDAERGILEAARERIRALDAQIEPLAEFESLREVHGTALLGLPMAPDPGRALTVPAVPRRADGGDRGPSYRSAGEFMVDLLRARGIMHPGDAPDEGARARVQQSRALANQTTSDTPGILPTPIVGTVVNLIDANRPLISSLGGAKALGGIPGITFTRPKITQHTVVGPQPGEKQLLPSQKMIIGSVPFSKQTYGGTVDISRQDIDWTSPAAWDILIRDLADVYAIQTETAVATAFEAAATGAPVEVADNTLAGWALALYTAAAQSYSFAKRMPDRVWCSLDVWAALGSLVDVGRLVMPPAQTEQPAGATELASFRGDVIGLPRIVVPTFPAKTCIVGPSSLYEVYEEVIGLLSVVEPSILGVTVAYGGYVAFGGLAEAGFVTLTAPADLPLVASMADAPADDSGSGSGSKSSKSS